MNMIVKTATQGLKVLWLKKFFKEGRTIDQIKKALEKLECNPSDSSLGMALNRSKFLGKKGKKRNYKYKQKHASREILLNEDILSEKLIKDLGKEFETEISDLKLNFGRSGTCTAFLLRKILEKLIFLAFSKNGISNQLRGTGGRFVGLKTMVDLAAANEIRGKPFLMSKTAKEIGGIKFLGDAAAHNPLTNVEMRTIILQMPFIITAYEELSNFI